jgi:hypothetical protein
MRECGECTLCCKIIGVQTLNKPQHVWCPHCKIGSGCTIYETRPQSCCAYRCRFLVDESLDESWRPSRCGMVINTDRRRVVVQVDPERGDAWRQAPYYATFKQWAHTALPGWPVFITIGKRVIGVYTNRDVPIAMKLP